MSGGLDLTRRKALAGVGVAAAAVSVPFLDDAQRALSGSPWQTATVDTDEALHDVAVTAAAPFAVGDNGTVVHRTGAATWKRVVDDGPGGDGRNLLSADASDDGKRLWFAGASGALGVYDVDTGSLQDHSAPNDRTGNFTGLAVTGNAGSEHVYVTDQAGHVLASHDAGETWSQTTPGSGAEIPAVDFHAPRAGHLCTTNGTVFATSDGDTWEKVGVEDANVDYHGVESDAPDDVVAVGDGGVVRTFDGSTWRRADLGDAGLEAVTTTSDGGAVVGDGGAIFEEPGTWSRVSTPTGKNLHGVIHGNVVAAVGAGGTILERR